MEQWKGGRRGEDFSVITAKTTSCYSFSWQAGFHWALSNTNYNSYKSSPNSFLIEGQKGGRKREEKSVSTFLRDFP